MSEKDVKNKRAHVRKPTKVEVEMMSDGNVDKAPAKDISLCGIYIKKPDSDGYKLDGDIVLAFESKDGEEHTVEGKIVRKDKEGIGIRFKRELIAIALEHAQEWL